jgi:hypothetical protein
MQIAVLEGYRVPHRKKPALAMLHRRLNACAVDHRVASRGFWACVRGGRRRSR